MRKYLCLISRFLFMFIISFVIVGYVKNGFMVKIDWVADATLWSKLKWYYGYNFTSSLIPSLILALIINFIYHLIIRKKVIK